MLKDELDSVIVKQAPWTAVLHQDGEIVGYVLVTPTGVVAAMEGGSVIRADDVEAFDRFWPGQLDCEMSLPVEVRGS